MLLLTLCLLVGLANDVRSQSSQSSLPVIDLSKLGFTTNQLSCPTPEIRILQSRLTPEQLKLVIEVTQRAAVQNIGQNDYTAIALAEALSLALNGTWHVVIATGPLAWHVHFDDNFFVSYQFGGLAIVAFRRDRKSEVLIPANQFREFVASKLNELTDDDVRQPGALEALVTAVENQYGGQWFALSAQSKNVVVYSTAGSIYQDAHKKDRVIGLWSVDIPNYQITDFSGKNIPNGQPEADLQFIQNALQNGTAEDQAIVKYFVDRNKGDWTAVSHAEGYGASEESSNVIVQVYDATYVGAINEDIPVRFTEKGNRTYLADFAKQMVETLAFLGVKALPNVLADNFQRKFGGQWTAVCGDANKLSLSSTRKERAYESSVKLGKSKKCVVWLIKTEPLIHLTSPTPTTNMFSSMVEDALQAASEALLYNAGDRLAIAQYICDVMKEKYGSEWHAAVSDTLMSIAVDQNEINYLLVQSPDWMISVMQTNVAAKTIDETQLKFLETEANIAITDFLSGSSSRNASDSSSAQAAGLKPNPSFDPLSDTNPDQVIRRAMVETFGGNWATVVVVPNTYAIASTISNLPLLSVKLTVNKANFDVKALQLAPTVLIRQLSFVSNDKIMLALNTTTNHLVTAGKTSEDTFGELAGALNTALGETFNLLSWNAYVGLANESAYSFQFDEPNWMVMLYKNIEVVIFSRDTTSSSAQFNLTQSEATKPIQSDLSQLAVDPTRQDYDDIASTAYQVISGVTNVPWQVAAGRKGSYAVKSSHASYIVQYESANNATTPSTVIQYSLWLA